ncbi:hypothetical protein [Flavobacterium sp.]|uniref:C1q-like domain-containing protein n=1 Tax=Flavobacterium sp. TaxID=239 RepID=UPI0035282DC4
MKPIVFYLIITCSFYGAAQVGINTSSPNAQLDINGDLIIQDVPEANYNEQEKILVVDNNINRVKSINLPKTFISAAGGTGFSVLSLVLISGWNAVSFPTIIFDENNDYNTTDQYFEVPVNGIYEIDYYVKMASIISLADVGVGVIKRNTSGTYSLEGSEVFSSFNLLGIQTTPMRRVHVLLKLEAGDQIYFAIKSSNLTVFGSANAQFSIQQVK